MGCVMQTNFFHSVLWKRVGTVVSTFSPLFCTCSRHYLAFKLRGAVKHMISSYNLKHIATKLKKILMWLHVLRFSNWDSCFNHFVFLLVLKLHDLCRQTQRKHETTVYLSTFTIFCVVSLSSADSIAVPLNHFRIIEELSGAKLLLTGHALAQNYVL